MQRRTFLQVGAGAVGASSFLGTGAGRRVTQETFEPLGSIDISGAADAAVHHDNEIVYVAGEDGFGVVDITDPDDPTLIAQRREIGPENGDTLQLVWDLWPWNDRLVVGGPAMFDQNSAFGFALFDISEPAEPEQVAFFETADGSAGDHHIHNTYFEDGVVYLTGSGLPDQPLVIVDVSDDDPVELNRWSVTDHEPGYLDVPVNMRVIHDMYVQDEIAYIAYWDAGTWIVDVSDPEDPTVLSHVGDYELSELREFDWDEGNIEALIPPGNAHYAQVNEDGTILVVGEEAWEVVDDGERRGGPGGVDLYNVSDETDPSHLARIDAPDSFDQTQEGWFTSAHNCDIVGDRLYTSWYFGGVRIHDISDPEDPEEIAWWRKPRETSFWTAQAAGDVFVASSANVREKLGSDDLNETREALYVFPDRAGKQQDPPSLTDRPTDVFGPDDGGSDDSHNGGETNETDGEIADEQADDDETADSFGPGFGVLGAVAGVGGASYVLSRRRDE